MTRIITALFDSRADADAGSERLKQAGVDASNVAIHDQTSHKTAGEYSTRHDKGLWATVKGVFVPDSDRHVYEEGIRRGGFLLTAEVDDDKTPDAVRALEDANTVDVDARSEQWRSDGWQYQSSDDRDLVGDTDDDLPWGSRDKSLGEGRLRTYLPIAPD